MLEEKNQALFTRVRYGTFSLPSVPKSGTERGCVHTGTEKNQAVRSKTGPEIGRYGKVNQKLERYDIVPFRSRVNRSGTISYSLGPLYRSSLGPLSGPVSFLRGDTKLVSMTTSDIEIEIRPNCF